MSDTIGEFYPIEGLTPHPKNPRQNEEAVSQIARSIERFGFTSPIIAREQDKTIIAGHTRWKAAQKIGRFPANVYQCSKPQRSEKEQGLDHLSDHISAAVELHGKDSKGLNSPRAGAGRTAENVKNFHPTVKPIKLMRWLCRLLTPKGGVVLDPFLGSGTTAVSAILEGFNAVGCEMTEDYYPIIQGRVNWAKSEREKQISGEDE